MTGEVYIAYTKRMIKDPQHQRR